MGELEAGVIPVTGSDQSPALGHYQRLPRQGAVRWQVGELEPVTTASQIENGSDTRLGGSGSDHIASDSE